MTNRPRPAPRPEVLTVLELIPSDGWITDAALTEKARDLGGVEIVDGSVRGLRALRRRSAVIVRKSDDGLSYARTPTGTGILQAWVMHHQTGHDMEATG